MAINPQKSRSDTLRHFGPLLNFFLLTMDFFLLLALPKVNVRAKHTVTITIRDPKKRTVENFRLPNRVCDFKLSPVSCSWKKIIFWSIIYYPTLTRKIEWENLMGKLNQKIELQNRIGKLNCKIELENWIAKFNGKIELENLMGKLNGKILNGKF